MTIREDWRNLKPQLGNFLGKLTEMADNVDNFDVVIEKVRTKAYNTGYQKGCTDTRDKDLCINCKKKDFYAKYNAGCGDMLEAFSRLHPTSKRLILDMIRRLNEVENG